MWRLCSDKESIVPCKVFCVLVRRMLRHSLAVSCQLHTFVPTVFTLQLIWPGLTKSSHTCIKLSHFQSKSESCRKTAILS